MKGVDTNILVRFLTGDDEIQAEKVYRIFKQCEQEKTQLLVPLLVILELIWVLESAYRISRDQVLDSISDLIIMPVLKFENLSVLQQFVQAAKNNSYDLSDLLIAHSAKFQNCDNVITFDKKASKFDLFQLIA